MSHDSMDSLEAEPLLRVEGLRIGMRRKRHADVALVRDVSFDIAAGERYGIVGESGSGKSLTLRAVAGLLPAGVEVLSGQIWFDGQDLLTMPKRDRRALMGRDIAMIFQEPMTALNPTMRVGRQIAEGPRRYLDVSAQQAYSIALDMMRATGIPDPKRRARAYPHELSGGLRQRVMISMALACKPRLVLCDEPTTALDVTVQDQVLRLLSHLCEETGTALAFVTHDLAVVNQTCSWVSVMYAGALMEKASVRDLVAGPLHPYTEGLFESAPDLDEPDRTLTPIPGLPPQLAHLPTGCPFAPRCKYVRESCWESPKPLAPVRGDRSTACDRWADIFKVAP